MKCSVREELEIHQSKDEQGTKNKDEKEALQ